VLHFGAKRGTTTTNIIWVIKLRRMTGRGTWHKWGREEVHTRVWWGNLRERDHLENLGLDGKIILR
jgi:hypothetical protein